MFGKDYTVKLLPHHVGIFTGFYMDSSIIQKAFEYAKKGGYSDEFLRNEKLRYEQAMMGRNVNVEVVLVSPDSVCMPSGCDVCKDCLDISQEDLKESSLHLKFEEAFSISMEILYLLHYTGLEPERQYTSDEFKEIVNETGKNIFDLLRFSNRLKDGSFPQTLTENYRWEKKHKVDEKFPLAGQFYVSDIYRDIISRRLNEQLFADNHVTDDEIIDIIEKHPGFFTDEPMDAYKEAMVMLDA